MSNPRSDREAVIQAIQAAKRAHLDRAPIGSGGWVDVFGAILHSGVALMFKPLSGLYGAYLPERENRQAGVLINSSHPLALQRYTAAHEFGHYRMNHSPSLDGEDEIVTRAHANRRHPQEIAADTFAAFFLMPLRLLGERIKSMGLTASTLADPASVYALSLSFGVSYAAMVRHLEEARYINAAAAARLRESTPQSVKQRLLAGVELEDARSDVREFHGMPKDLVTLRVGDALILTLPSHAAGGYEWRLEGDAGEALSVRGHSPNTEIPADHAGVSAAERLVVRCSTPGVRVATFAERRPWESEVKDPLTRIEVAVEVLARPLGLYRSSLTGA